MSNKSRGKRQKKELPRQTVNGRPSKKCADHPAVQNAAVQPIVKPVYKRRKAKKCSCDEPETTVRSIKKRVKRRRRPKKRADDPAVHKTVARPTYKPRSARASAAETAKKKELTASCFSQKLSVDVFLLPNIDFYRLANNKGNTASEDDLVNRPVNADKLKDECFRHQCFVSLIPLTDEELRYWSRNADGTVVRHEKRSDAKESSDGERLGNESSVKLVGSSDAETRRRGESAAETIVDRENSEPIADKNGDAAQGRERPMTIDWNCNDGAADESPEKTVKMTYDEYMKFFSDTNFTLKSPSAGVESQDAAFQESSSRVIDLPENDVLEDFPEHDVEGQSTPAETLEFLDGLPSLAINLLEDDLFDNFPEPPAHVTEPQNATFAGSPPALINWSEDDVIKTPSDSYTNTVIFNESAQTRIDWMDGEFIEATSDPEVIVVDQSEALVQQTTVFDDLPHMAMDSVGEENIVESLFEPDVESPSASIDLPKNIPSVFDDTMEKVFLDSFIFKESPLTTDLSDDEDIFSKETVDLHSSAMVSRVPASWRMWPVFGTIVSGFTPLATHYKQVMIPVPEPPAATSRVGPRSLELGRIARELEEALPDLNHLRGQFALWRASRPVEWFPVTSDYDLIGEELAEWLYYNGYIHPRYKCARCNQTFLTRNGRDRLHVHMGLWLGQPHQCTRCGDVFETSKMLALHEHIEYGMHPKWPVYLKKL